MKNIIMIAAGVMAAAALGAAVMLVCKPKPCTACPSEDGCAETE